MVSSSIIAIVAAAGLAQAAPAIDPCIPATGSYWVSASQAHLCELNVPYDQARAKSVIDTTIKYMQYYSTESYFIKSPNPQIPHAFNLEKNLKAISNKVNSKKGYKSDWDFTIAITDAVNAEKDGHTTVFFGCNYAFSWNIPVSIATLGDSPTSPFTKPYFVVNYDFPNQARPGLEDYYKGLGYNYRKYNNLEITKINGQDAATYLVGLADNSSVADAGLYTGFESLQARYMRLMTRYSADTTSGQYTQEVARFAQRGFYPNAGSVTITVLLANGKEENVHVPWAAHYTGTGTDTPSFISSSCFTPPATGAVKVAVPEVQGPKEAIIADGTQAEMKEIMAKVTPNYNYVVPNLTSYGHLTTLDFYRLEKHPKVGVMYFEQFEPSDGTTSSAYFNGVSRLMYTAMTKLKQDGVTHLLIDQSGNRGGYILAGAIALWSLFPNDLYPGFPAVFRDLDIARRESDLAAAQGSKSRSDFYYGDYRDLSYNYLKNNTQFMDPPVPVTVNGVKDAFSQQFFDDFGTAASLTNFTSPPFAPADMAMVANSICGSTCSVFSSYIYQKHGVQSVVFGGLPNQVLDTAQFDAGVKGSEVTSLSSRLSGLRSVGLQNDTAAPQPLVVKAASFNCNFRNAIPYINQQDEILEFSFDQATKHYQFTKQTYNNPQAVWEYAAEQMWGQN